jgi:hypothetical protein
LAAADLYDPWLDVVAGSAKGPAESIVIAARAVVRPRVLSPGGTTSTPLVEEVKLMALLAVLLVAGLAILVLALLF